MQDQPVTVTAVCEADRHYRCAGQVISLVAPPGQVCACHGLDLATERRLEAEHFGEVA
jgi:hypothetical protein